MKRLTLKIEEDFYVTPDIHKTDELKYRLGKLEDLLEKYNVNSIEELEKILKIFFMRN